ncbi:MAG: sulfotransferase [Deltaproteobacteria bacterium]|nr:sulfotransferase [Deltaproteobacteria bacterium]
MSVLPNNDSFVFIIGSPRSGTTILGEILDKHNEISQWYEPYFVWDRSFRNSPDDERTAEEATPRIIKQVYKDYLRYKKKTGSKIIVDKSPRNSLKIPFIRQIFPQARFIHILRDGRDVSLSIHKEWIRRKEVISDSTRDYHFNYNEALGVVNRWLKRQPFIKDKIEALWFETHGHLINKALHLNRLRWNGEIGWGPRFKGWEEIFHKHSLLQFNAYQWLKCVERIYESWTDIPSEYRMEVRYEKFVGEGETIITDILSFIGLSTYKEFFVSMPKLKINNYDKWRKELSKEQLKEIGSILTPMLMKLGYENTRDWLEEIRC